MDRSIAENQQIWLNHLVDLVENEVWLVASISSMKCKSFIWIEQTSCLLNLKLDALLFRLRKML